MKEGLIMKYKQTIIICLISLLVVGLVSFYTGKISGINSMFEESKVSLSGNYEFMKVKGYKNSKYIQILILPTISNNSDSQRQGNLLEEIFYIRFSMNVSWGENDTLWINSSDKGIYYWTIIEENWVKNKADDQSILLAPENIKKYWEEIKYN